MNEYYGIDMTFKITRFKEYFPFYCHLAHSKLGPNHKFINISKNLLLLLFFWGVLSIRYFL